MHTLPYTTKAKLGAFRRILTGTKEGRRRAALLGSWLQQGRHQQAEMPLRCFKTLPSLAPRMGGQVLAMRPAPPTPNWGVARAPRSKPSLKLGASVKTQP